jgi:hypothetical protein
MISDLAAGIAGEHLVCADLILKGFTAFMTDQSCPYDIVLETEGRMIRVQVKTTREPKPQPQRKHVIPAYIWHVKKAGKGGKRYYNDGDFDLFAMVALDCRKIAYIPYGEMSVNSLIIKEESEQRYQGYRDGRRFENLTIEKAIKSILNKE